MSNIRKPYHISAKCANCNSILELSSLVENPDCPEDEIWHDEWLCIACNVVYLDWPKKRLDALNEELERRLKEMDEHPERNRSWKDIKRRKD